MSRLTSSQYNNGSGWSTNYTEQLSYDATGRIQTLRRYGGGGRLIDDLQYTYQDARLQKVEDKGAVDGHPQGTTHYGYDGNGNLIKDGSTGISNNLLNLPEHIQPSIGRSLKHTYAADGRKLIAAAQSDDGEYESYYSYAGNLVFDGNNELEYIIIPEGRILYNKGLPTIEYHLKDHLGNVRVAFTPGFRTPFIAQDNTYYPFGGLIKELSYDSPTPFIEFTPGGYLSMGAKTNPFRYNGKELVNAYNLGWYDYGSRYYNPALGLFNSVDPQAHKFPGWNPYAYGLNSPLNYIDPNGELPFLAILGIGAAVSGILNWAFNGAQFNAEGLGYFGIGALSGAAAVATGGAAASLVGTVGFVGGAITGAAAGFSGGFVTGSGNAWMGGAGFGAGLVSGFQSGGIGALAGGMTGGILGGIQAVNHGGNFWSGKGAIFDNVVSGATSETVQIGEGMEYSNEYARGFSDEYFGKVNGVKKLYADGSLPPGYKRSGDLVLNRKGETVLGSSAYLGPGKGSNVYLYKQAFTSMEELYLTMGHEYIHAGLHHIGISGTDKHHMTIRYWEFQQAKSWGLNYQPYLKEVNKLMPSYKLFKDFYEKAGFYVLPWRPW